MGLPLLVVFDLDDTVWYPEMYMIDGPPFTVKEGRVYDKRGTEVKIIKGAGEVLEELRSDHPDVKIGFASRTNYPQWAFECLKLFTLSNGETLDDIAEFKEIYPGDKKTHFRSFRSTYGIEFEDMLFFDNENRNCISVSKLNVKCVYTPEGMTYDYWQKGLRLFA